MANQHPPVESLKSPQIARILVALLGGMSKWCDPAEIEKAVKWLAASLPSLSIKWKLNHASAQPPRNKTSPNGKA